VKSRSFSTYREEKEVSEREVAVSRFLLESYDMLAIRVSQRRSREERSLMRIHAESGFNLSTIRDA